MELLDLYRHMARSRAFELAVGRHTACGCEEPDEDE